MSRKAPALTDAVSLAAGLALALAAPPLAAQSVNISGLSDVSFGALRPVNDARRAQSLCVFSDLPGRGYLVTATGSGTSGAFVLDGGGGAGLPFAVEWADQPSVDQGMPLNPGQPLGGQTSTAIDATCGSGPARTASLVVVIARADLAAAGSATNYSGTLTLVIAPQ